MKKTLLFSLLFGAAFYLGSCGGGGGEGDGGIGPSGTNGEYTITYKANHSLGSAMQINYSNPEQLLIYNRGTYTIHALEVEPVGTYEQSYNVKLEEGESLQLSMTLSVPTNPASCNDVNFSILVNNTTVATASECGYIYYALRY